MRNGPTDTEAVAHPSPLARARALIEELQIRYPKAAEPPNTSIDEALDSEGPIVPIFDARLVRCRSDEYSPEKYDARRERLAKHLRARGCKRLLGAVVDTELMSKLDSLKETHPNFREVLEEVACEATLAQLKVGAVTGLRILLLGPPGVGKTDFALRMADALRLPLHLVGMATAQAAAHLGGSDEYWGNTQPGAVFEALTSGRFANPLFVLDEVEKTAWAGSGGDPLGALYQLLERRTAAHFCDRSVPWLPIDASHINWIATSNSVENVHPALLSRFSRHRIAPPHGEHQRALMRRIFKQMLCDLGAADRISAELNSEDVSALSGQSIREARGVLRLAIARAIQDGHSTVSIACREDFGPRRIGFL